MKKYDVKNTTRDLGYRIKESQKLEGKKYLLSSQAHLWQRTAEKENLDFLTNAFLFKGQYRIFCQILEPSHSFTLYLDNIKKNWNNIVFLNQQKQEMHTKPLWSTKCHFGIHQSHVPKHKQLKKDLNVFGDLKSTAPSRVPLFP